MLGTICRNHRKYLNQNLIINYRHSRSHFVQSLRKRTQSVIARSHVRSYQLKPSLFFFTCAELSTQKQLKDSKYGTCHTHNSESKRLQEFLAELKSMIPIYNQKFDFDQRVQAVSSLLQYLKSQKENFYRQNTIEKRCFDESQQFFEKIIYMTEKVYANLREIRAGILNRHHLAQMERKGQYKTVIDDKPSIYVQTFLRKGQSDQQFAERSREKQTLSPVLPPTELRITILVSTFLYNMTQTKYKKENVQAVIKYKEYFSLIESLFHLSESPKIPTQSITFTQEQFKLLCSKGQMLTDRFRIQLSEKLSESRYSFDWESTKLLLLNRDEFLFLSADSLSRIELKQKYLLWLQKLLPSINQQSCDQVMTLEQFLELDFNDLLPHHLFNITDFALTMPFIEGTVMPIISCFSRQIFNFEQMPQSLLPKVLNNITSTILFFNRFCLCQIWYLKTLIGFLQRNLRHIIVPLDVDRENIQGIRYHERQDGPFQAEQYKTDQQTLPNVLKCINIIYGILFQTNPTFTEEYREVTTNMRSLISELKGDFERLLSQLTKISRYFLVFNVCRFRLLMILYEAEAISFSLLTDYLQNQEKQNFQKNSQKAFNTVKALSEIIEEMPPRFIQFKMVLSFGDSFEVIAREYDERIAYCKQSRRKGLILSNDEEAISKMRPTIEHIRKRFNRALHRIQSERTQNSMQTLTDPAMANLNLGKGAAIAEQQCIRRILFGKNFDRYSHAPKYLDEEILLKILNEPLTTKQGKCYRNLNKIYTILTILSQNPTFLSWTMKYSSIELYKFKVAKLSVFQGWAPCWNYPYHSDISLKKRSLDKQEEWQLHLKFTDSEEIKILSKICKQDKYRRKNFLHLEQIDESQMKTLRKKVTIFRYQNTDFIYSRVYDGKPIVNFCSKWLKEDLKTW